MNLLEQAAKQSNSELEADMTPEEQAWMSQQSDKLDSQKKTFHDSKDWW